MSLLRRWWQQRARQAGRRLDEAEEQGRFRQWFLLTGRCDFPGLSAPQAECLRPTYPSDEAFWGDPFCWSRDGRLFVFFEEFPFAEGRGHISAMALTADGAPAGEPMRVIDEPCHLSYPFLLEYGGELYMIPEKAGTGRVDLYRCMHFPDGWQFVKTLIDGLALSDPTLFEHDGRWWLFGALARRRLRVNESLVAFYADNPLSDRWVSHRNNPLVRDFSRGRPGGRIVRLDNGSLLRPSQDCVRRYGHGLNLNEILALSPRHYEERLVWRASGEQLGGWRALHHLDWHRGMIAMDAQRLIPRPATGP